TESAFPRGARARKPGTGGGGGGGEQVRPLRPAHQVCFAARGRSRPRVRTPHAGEEPASCEDRAAGGREVLRRPPDPLRKGRYEPVVLRADDPSFKPGDVYFHNHADKTV